MEVAPWWVVYLPQLGALVGGMAVSQVLKICYMARRRRKPRTYVMIMIGMVATWVLMFITAWGYGDSIRLALGKATLLSPGAPLLWPLIEKHMRQRDPEMARALGEERRGNGGPRSEEWSDEKRQSYRELWQTSEIDIKDVHKELEDARRGQR